MATPADQRLLELLDKWRKSLELHAKYSSLDDDSYWKIQPWAEHQRPSRWIIDLALQKTQALNAAIEQRIAAGDGAFSDSLELMIFLANLVGSEHIERFIPVAEGQNERTLSASPAETARPADPASVTGTREMPRLPPPGHAPALVGSAQVARTERRPSAKSAPRPTRRPPRLGAPAKPAPAARDSSTVEHGDAPRSAEEQVVADAIRLAQWGRKWFEMPELIARMAGRPPLAEVRRILKVNKTAIDEKAKGG